MVRQTISGTVTLFLACATACAQPAPREPGEQIPSASDTISGESVVAPRSMEQIKLSFAPVVERVAPAVVNVYTKRVVQQRSPFAGDPFFERFFGQSQPRERVQNSLGSGVIVSPDGFVVTNNHVIEGMTEITVVLSDRREYQAELLLADPQTDLAVLQISADETLPFLTFANSDAAQVGDIVLAIGNPFGVGQTVTSGIVSALARTAVSVSDYQFFIQTDAAINPGNSGGALVDGEGRLLGVNTAIYSRSGGSNGIGFAIPSRLVQQVLKTAVDGGVLVRPWIGASTTDVDGELARALDLDRPVGVILNGLWNGGPADRAALKEGDVIIEVDGQPVYDGHALNYRVGVKDDGDEASVVYIRNGKQRETEITLDLPPESPARDPRVLSGSHPLNGVTVDNLSPRYNEELGLDPLSAGVVVAQVESRSFAARRGLRPGMKILSVNGGKIDTAADLERELNRPAQSWRFELETGNGVQSWRVGG
ncbi:MAG: DegQ family serine endoprotease [Pseudomonadota bacterium]